MRDTIVLFVAATALASLLGLISIWAPRRATIKIAALLALTGFLPLTYLSLAGLLSRPKPLILAYEESGFQEAQVLGSSLKEGEAIFLWLQLPGFTEPRAYALPWSREMAQQLEEAKRKAEENGGGIGLKLPFERSWDRREPKFYAMPQPALPPKDWQAPPKEYQRQEKDA